MAATAVVQRPDALRVFTAEEISKASTAFPRSRVWMGQCVETIEALGIVKFEETFNALAASGIFTREELVSGFIDCPMRFAESISAISDMGLDAFVRLAACFELEKFSKAFADSDSFWEFLPKNRAAADNTAAILNGLVETGVFSKRELSETFYTWSSGFADVVSIAGKMGGAASFAAAFKKLEDDGPFAKGELRSAFSRMPDYTARFVQIAAGAPLGTVEELAAHLCSKYQGDDWWIRVIFTGWGPEDAGKAMEEEIAAQPEAAGMMRNAHDFFSGLRPGDRIVAVSPGAIPRDVELGGLLIGMTRSAPDGRAVHYIVAVTGRDVGGSSVGSDINIQAAVRIATEHGTSGTAIGLFHTHPTPHFESGSDVNLCNERQRSICAGLFNAAGRASVYDPVAGKMREVECVQRPELPQELEAELKSRGI